MNSRRVEWPVWQKGAELRASDLMGLESFVFAKHNLFDPTYGVYSVGPTIPVSVEFLNDRARVAVGEIRAVCPSGHPVIVASDQSLETEFHVGTKATFLCDLCIAVNPETEGGRDGSEVMKYRLDASEVPSNSTTPLVAPGKSSVYLGRYRLMREPQSVAVVAWPLPYKLGTFARVDVDWGEWTRPLSERLATLASELSKRAPANTVHVAATAEVIRLAVEWPNLSIHTLWQRLQLLRSMLVYDGVSGPRSVVEVPPQFDDSKSRDLPRQLAAILSDIDTGPRKGVAFALVVGRDVFIRVRADVVEIEFNLDLPRGAIDLFFERTRMSTLHYFRSSSSSERIRFVQPELVNKRLKYHIDVPVAIPRGEVLNFVSYETQGARQLSVRLEDIELSYLMS